MFQKHIMEKIASTECSFYVMMGKIYTYCGTDGVVILVMVSSKEHLIEHMMRLNKEFSKLFKKKFKCQWENMKKEGIKQPGLTTTIEYDKFIVKLDYKTIPMK